MIAAESCSKVLSSSSTSIMLNVSAMIVLLARIWITKILICIDQEKECPFSSIKESIDYQPSV